MLKMHTLVGENNEIILLREGKNLKSAETLKIFRPEFMNMAPGFAALISGQFHQITQAYRQRENPQNFIFKSFATQIVIILICPRFHTVKFTPLQRLKGTALLLYYWCLTCNWHLSKFATSIFISNKINSDYMSKTSLTKLDCPFHLKFIISCNLIKFVSIKAIIYIDGYM